jgi:cytochrome c
MRSWVAIGIVAILSAWVIAQGRYGIGQPLNEEEVRQWNIRPSILATGVGLPPGQGSVDDGAKTYEMQCAGCHGGSGEGGAFNRLVAEPFAISKETSNRDFAIGNYWQYPTTLFDYIRRAMPFATPGTLKDDEVYALVAYILYQNGIIDGTEPMNGETLPKVQMPARELLQLDPLTAKKFPWLKLP